MYSLVSSAKADGDELDDLLPDRWLRRHPESAWTIDSLRRAERSKKKRR
jgi:hypothetical protein